MNANNKWNAIILILILGFVISGCGPGQIVAPTQTPTSPHTPALTETPTQAPSPTQTLTPLPTYTPTPIPSLPPGVKNLVQVFFNNSISFDNKGLVFTNHEVNGFSHWATHLQNIPDVSCAPVYGLGLEFEAITDNIGTNIRKNYLVSAEYPTYQWFFGNVPEEPLREVYVSEAYIESAHGIPFTPGFDASLSLDKTTFSQPDIQKITITIIPRVKMTYPGITVHTQGGPHENASNADISDIPPGEQKGLKGEVISVSPNKKDLFVNDMQLEVNQLYSFSFSIKVEPYAPNTTYIPYVSISWLPKPESSNGDMENGTKVGKTLTWPIENVGTWTWTADGEYQLEWHGGTVYLVNFGG